MECLRLWVIGYSYRQIAERPDIGVSYVTVGADIRLALKILRGDGLLGLLEMLIETFGRRQIIWVLGRAK